MSRLARPLSASLVLLLLLALYLPTLQHIPNGSSHYFMLDVGETQIVLNEWGSLHSTGYPLYVISGNVLRAALHLGGISRILAPALVSLFWSLLALSLLLRLARRLGAGPWLAAGVTLLFGLTRSVWIHSVIAEIYSFTLLLLLTLLLPALGKRPRRGHLYRLALLGGIALAHHRAVLALVPALVYAAWPELEARGRKLPRALLVSALLGMTGFAQYLWPWLRARAGADWVYGQPGTLRGLWDEIAGAEAARFIGPPASLPALIENFSLVNHALLNEIGLPGALAGTLGLALGARRSRAARVLLLLASGAWSFHVLLYRDTLTALILPVTLGLACGWLFLGETLRRARWPGLVRLAGGIALASAAPALVAHNAGFIRELTTDPTGLETATALAEAPPGATVMLAWGTRHFAAVSAQRYLGQLTQIKLVADKSDLAAIIAEGMLLTPDYTFFNQPPAWWEERLGAPVWLQAAGPRLVQISAQPVVGAIHAGGTHPLEVDMNCRPHALLLDVTWSAGVRSPAEDLSVFVKAFAAEGRLLAQADQFAPVYGLRPLTSWQAGERVRDIYSLKVAPREVTEVRFGLYRRRADGTFEDVQTWVQAPYCPELRYNRRQRIREQR